MCQRVEAVGSWRVSPSVISILALVGVLTTTACVCQNEIVEQVESPDARHRVVIFQRGCGATTATATHAVLVPSSVERNAIPLGTGSLFVAETDQQVTVKWLNNAAIEFTYDADARLVLTPEVVDGVQIRFIKRS